MVICLSYNPFAVASDLFSERRNFMSGVEQNIWIVARLAAGSPILRRGGEGWRQGHNRLSEKDIQALVRSELLAVNGDCAHLTETGRAHIERMLSPDTPNRWMVERGRAGRARILANLNESPLGWLMRRGFISETQFAAGERLRGDFIAAGRMPQVTMRWETPTGRPGAAPAGAPDPTAAQIAARARFDAACKAAGPGLEDVLARVVCLGGGLETTERAFGWPARAGKVVLGIALDRLASHYAVGRR